jgi:hypothetical protein
MTPMAAPLTAALFRPHLGSSFLVRRADGPETEIELAEVREVSPQPGAPRQDPFTLLFSGPTEHPLGQGLHSLEHSTMGTLEIFLVPVSPESYEAVFN